MGEFVVISFESTNFAMQAESVLKGESLGHQVIPTPREITLSCGLSIRTATENLDRVFNLIDQGKMRVKALYTVSGTGMDRKIEKIEGR